TKPRWTKSLILFIAVPSANSSKRLVPCFSMPKSYSVEERVRLLLLFFMLLSLVGCATERTVLVNSQGEELTCETSGAGFFVSVPNQQQKCIADAEKRGYRLK